MISNTYEDKQCTLMEELSSLYETDPAQFEIRSKELIDMTIESFPNKFKDRAKGIQFQIESRLNTMKDPVSRLNLMIELFWENFSEFQRAINDPGQILSERRNQDGCGKVIPLRPN